MSYLETAKESLEALRRRRAGSYTAAEPERAIEPRVERVAAMTLDEFAQAGLIFRVRSGVLDRDVLFVSDDVRDDALAGTDLPIFRSNELRKLELFRPRPRDPLRLIDVMTIFDGTNSDVRPRDHHAGRKRAAAHRRRA